MIDIKQYILDKSKVLDIDIIGFTDGEPLCNLEGYLDYRVEKDRTTEFEERYIKKRIDPKLTFPDCKSIIVIGISYNVDYKHNSYLLKGCLSRSSWGIDYHRVLKDKMEALVQEIGRKIDFKYKYFVDTGPLVERELAKKAGIGYYGKNCSIVNHDYGSFIFLGHIMTDLDLSLDNPVEDNCGDCDLCIKACPTNALKGDYTMNSKRCVSYLTQTKGNIPEALMEKMGINIYGCDTCQLVCPKNKGIKKSIHRDFIPEETNGIIDIEELLNMTNRQFKNKYGPMAASWRGKNILKRNAIIALGNMKDSKNIDLLISEKKKNNPLLKPYIDWAMSRIRKGH